MYRKKLNKMTNSQLMKAFKTIKQEKLDRNLTEIYVDLENVSIRCDQIGIYVSNGITYKNILQVCHSNETISLIEDKYIKNIRWTNSNNETFKILKEN